MNWENIGNEFEEEKEPDQDLRQQKEAKIQYLLQKFKDPAEDPKRQEYIQFINIFNYLLVTGRTEQIANTMINEDTQSFLVLSAKGLPAQHYIGPNGFIKLYNDRKIVQREVRQVYVDQEKETAIQICSCIVGYEDDGKLYDEYSFEIFTIKENKISKYRASFGSLTPLHNGEDPFVFTRKDQMLAKVKAINYALAGQPDFDKVASLLHETTEYHILSWEADQFHTFYQDNFAEEFRNLAVKFNLKCIIPYELYTDTQEVHHIKAQIVVSTYAYHLEENATGKSYVWLSTCAYAFDGNINIIKVSQQGELYPEDEIETPFESYDREKITQKMYDFFRNLKANLDIFYSDIMQYDCVIHRLGPHDLPTSRHYHGLDEINKLMKSLAPPEANIDWVKPADVFVDLSDPSYDVVVLVLNAQGTFHYDNYKYQGQHMNFLKFVRIAFENGKVAKFVKFLSEVPYPILSPFDNEASEGVNFRKLNKSDNTSI